MAAGTRRQPALVGSGDCGLTPGNPRIDPRGTAPHTSPMARKPVSEPSPVADFETSLDALEQLVEKMEHGEMSLEESLAAYERGVGL